MKKFLLPLALLAGCAQDRYITNTVEVPVEVPGPERIVEVEVPVEVMVPAPIVAPAPFQCQVFKNHPSLPTTHEVKGDIELGLSSLTLPEVADDTLPFPSFIGTAAETVTNNFALRCDFEYEVTRAGSHKFSLTSDDGSELYINGSRVINNGGSHAMLLKTGTVTLPAGIHKLQVRYFEGGGPKGLSLTVQEPAITPPATGF